MGVQGFEASEHALVVHADNSALIIVDDGFGGKRYGLTRPDQIIAYRISGAFGCRQLINVADVASPWALARSVMAV